MKLEVNWKKWFKKRIFVHDTLLLYFEIFINMQIIRRNIYVLRMKTFFLWKKPKFKNENGFWCQFEVFAAVFFFDFLSSYFFNYFFKLDSEFYLSCLFSIPYLVAQ